MKKQDVRINKTKKALFHTLLDLLETHNLNDITVTMLCKQSEINRSTFYAHYANIDELFELNLNVIMEKLNSEFEKSYPKMYANEKDALEHVLQHILDHRKVYEMLLSGKLPTKFTTVFIQECMKLPKKVILNKVKEAVDLDLYYTFCASAIISIINYWRKTNYAKTPLEMSEQIAMVFSNDLYK